MKPGGPLKRTKPLARGDSQLKRVPIKAKRSYSREQKDAAWRFTVLRSAGYRCARCRGVAAVAHHIAGRVGKLRHDLDNGLALCDACHRYVHAHVDESYAAGWMRKRN